MILILIITCLLSFAVGYILGNSGKITVNSKETKRRRAEIEQLQREYRNFLNYDGSEQS
ncbi:MAG: hypothetical protein IJ432_00010 [Clostridia bacterium]|nr:hypothetical protein [Clostridia bacterium]MEE1054307.1 hypothetical protein [Acutalibacteraceae bacterium]